MITPLAGYKVDPNNANGVVPINSDALASRYGAATPITGNVQTPSGATVNATSGALVAPPGTPVPPAPTTVSPLDQAQAQYQAMLPTGPVDEAAIRENVRKNMQGQIDTVNALYGNLTATQKNENNAAYKRVRGVNVAAGLAGSDFATANAQGAEEKGNQALAALENERAAKVSAVLGNIDQRATEEITKAKDDAKTNLKDYIGYLQTRQTGARDDIKTLASSGTRLEDLTPDQYQKLLNQSGYDDFTLKAVYNNSRAAAHKIDYQWKTVGNKLIGYGVDPLSGQISTLEKDLPNEVPKDYKPQVLDNGTIVFYPDQMDPTKPVKDQIITYDTGVRKDTRTANQKDSADTTHRLAPVSSAISALRDPQSGYVNPSAYSDMYQKFVETNPGHGKEFLDQYPVSVYIEPAQRNLFSTTGY